MKRIYSMGRNRYVHMDSYSASNETLGSRILQGLFVLIIASITASAMVGVNLIQLPSTNNHVLTR